MRNKRLTAFILAAITLCCAGATVSADSLEELQAQQAQTQSELDSVNGYIDNLESDKQVLLGQIDSVDQELVLTIAAIDSLNADIDQVTVDLEQTTADLGVAEEEQATEYAAMKKRIQYIYEQGGNAGWATLLLAGGDITEILNKAEYTQQMYDYDRQCLEEYAATVEKVATLKSQQEQQQSELVSMRNEQQTYQASLETQLASLRETSSNYDAELAKAQEIANQYNELISQQNEQIAIKQEEIARAAAEEAARQAAEAAAAAAAAADAEAAAQAQAAAEAAAQAAAAADAQAAQQAAAQAQAAAEQAGSSSSSSSSSSSGSATGQAIVNYACQFIGSPYVYGGTSITTGIDCSAFVRFVYAHFGYSLPRTSSEQRSVGYAVSYSEAQAGDIICYNGHVAIYMGDGRIVHAANPSMGVCIGSNAAYTTIITVRRLV